jgi:hypothetical protein
VSRGYLLSQSIRVFAKRNTVGLLQYGDLTGRDCNNTLGNRISEVFDVKYTPITRVLSSQTLFDERIGRMDGQALTLCRLSACSCCTVLQYGICTSNSTPVVLYQFVLVRTLCTVYCVLCTVYCVLYTVYTVNYCAVCRLTKLSNLNNFQ